MEVGSTVTWRESVVIMKDGRRIKTGERTVTGTIVEHNNLRTGAKTVRIEVTTVDGDGQDILGRPVWRKRVKLAKGKSWHRTTAKSKKPPKPKRR